MSTTAVNRCSRWCLNICKADTTERIQRDLRTFLLRVHGNELLDVSEKTSGHFPDEVTVQVFGAVRESSDGTFILHTFTSPALWTPSVTDTRDSSLNEAESVKQWLSLLCLQRELCWVPGAWVSRQSRLGFEDCEFENGKKKKKKKGKKKNPSWECGKSWEHFFSNLTSWLQASSC